MSPGVTGPVRRAIAWLQPPPRLVDWSIFAVVVFAAVSGITSFLGSTPEWAVLFWAHRMAGLALIPLIGFKLSRVRYRLTDTDQWQPSTLLSVVVALLAGATIATGVVWVFGIEPGLLPMTLLTVHAALGVLLVVLMGIHVWTRFRPPRRAEFDRRRTTLQFSAMLVGAAVVYRGQLLANALLDTPGDDRRFTGSHREEGTGNDSFPVVSWVADDPDPVDTEAWQLAVRGVVEEPIELSDDDLSPEATEEAVLDCTGGWYTVQEWAGIRVGDLLDAAGLREDAQYVRFVSVTGYRWSLPLDEAREALLATHVGGERLTHGHGAPLRLVAPDRRGFQWVKWIERVEVRRRGDPAQWVATLVSGFD